MYATLANRDVDCCLIPESPFYLEGKGGLFEYMEKTLKENGHIVIVIAEGAGQELLTESLDGTDASGNKLLKDVGLWMSHKIKVRMFIVCCLSEQSCMLVRGYGHRDVYILTTAKSYLGRICCFWSPLVTILFQHIIKKTSRRRGGSQSFC